MDLFQGIRTALGNIIKTPAATPVFSQATTADIGRPPVYPQPNTQTYINAFVTNASIHTLIAYLADKFGTIPRFCCEVEDQAADKAAKYMLKSRRIEFKKLKDLQAKAYGETPIQPSASLLTGTPEERLARLTARPNSVQGQDAYYAEVYMFHELTGDAFVELNRGIPQKELLTMDDSAIAKLPILEKIVRPSQYVNIVPSKMDVNEVLYYTFEDITGIYRKIPKVNMIHWKKINPLYDGTMGTHLRGLATLSAGLKLLTQDVSATDAAVSMQQNQGAKGILYNDGIANPDAKQVSDIRDVIDSNVNGARNKSSVSFLGGSKYGYLDIGQTSVDLQLTQSQQQVFIKLCNLFGVPPAIFLTETTYENLQEAGKSLLTNKILPACCAFRDEENRMVVPSFGLDPMKYTTDIDSTLITELAEDQTQVSIQLNNSPFMTLNEKREAMGLEALPDENFDKAYLLNTNISVDDLNVNDGLDSFTGSGGPGDSNQPGSGLHEQTNEETGNAGNSNNAAPRRSAAA